LVELCETDVVGCRRTLTTPGHQEIILATTADQPSKLIMSNRWPLIDGWWAKKAGEDHDTHCLFRPAHSNYLHGSIGVSVYFSVPLPV